MAKEKEVKTVEQVIAELDAKITEQNKALEEAKQAISLKDKALEEAKQAILIKDKSLEVANQTIQVKDKALQEATDAILELTEQLHQKKDVQAGNDTVTIQGKKYPLLLKEVNHKGKIVKYEDFVADEKLALELLEMDAGVFGTAL